MSRVCDFRRCGVISYTLGASGQRLLLSDEVLAHFRRHRQIARHSKEAGGQLFATFDGNRIQIERATGPRKSDRRGLRFFIPNRLSERREISIHFKAGLHYVGDWHTHPQPRPRPSSTDIDSFQDMFRRSRHKLAAFVVVIVGTLEPPEGMFVGLCTAEEVNRLAPDPVVS